MTARRRLDGRALLSALPCLLLFGSLATGQEWTRFRGPNGTGISEAKGIPTEFDEADYAWKVELPGTGHSQPVIWGEKIFLTAAPADGSARLVVCVGAEDGDILWKIEERSGEYHIHQRNSFASSSAAVDAERVYVPFAHPDEAFLVAYDHEGDEAWRYSLGGFHSEHGFGTSPMIFEDLVVFAKEHKRPPDGAEQSGFVVALDRETGDVRWRTPRRSRRTAYGTPCVDTSGPGDPRLLLTSGGQGIYALDARTGRPLWDANVFDKRTVSSPVFGSGLVFGTCGSGGGGNYLVAVRPGGEGDVTDTHVVYEIRQSAPYVPTPLVRDGRIYLWGDSEVVSCVDASTGERIWRGRVEGAFSGSPVWVEDRLFCISHQGEVVVLAAKDEFEVLARNPLGEMSRSTPAISGGRMYLRTLRHLIALPSKKVAASEGK